jgi:hypothetical protein
LANRRRESPGALQEVGCDNELFLAHCRAPAGVHARGSWLVELLRQPLPKAKKKPKRKPVMGAKKKPKPKKKPKRTGQS